MKPTKSQDQLMANITGGRTLDEQIECVRKYGIHGTAPLLRAGMLRALGIPEPKQRAKNLIIFGCYIPFWYPFMLRDYMKLLDLLSVEYTYLEKEFCCGTPVIMGSTGVDQKRVISTFKGFMELNHEMAQQKGAKTMAYCCVGCAQMTKGIFPEEADRHMYILDLIIEKLENETLKVTPTVAGYFEGCHSRYHAIFPKANLGWKRYRRLLDRIEGLKVVDLPQDNCCTKYPERIVENALKQNLDTILCPCNGCYNRIGATGKGRVQVKYLAEILLQSMGRK